jgi:hypothetical protein
MDSDTPGLPSFDDSDLERWRSMIPKSSRLANLEAVIERGRRTFLEVGNALMTIRDEKLYRVTHATWDGYCRDRWGISGRHGYRQIEATRTAEEMRPMGHTPRTEREARRIAHPPKLKALPPGLSQPENPPSSLGLDIGVHAEGPPPMGTYVEPPSAPPAAHSEALIECSACHHRFDPKEER